MERQVKIQYLSNAGLCIEANRKKIMIDVLCKNQDLPYKETPIEIKNKILLNQFPYDNIDFMLYTHEHIDHFDSESIDKYLMIQGDINSKVFLTPVAKNIIVEDTKNSKINKKITEIKLLKGQKEIVDNDFKITAISLVHDGAIYHNVDNIGYLIDINKKKILHVGDAAATEENFKHLGLAEEEIDLLFVPFTYINLESAFQIVEKYIKPKKMVIIHLPCEDLDQFQWRKNAFKRAEKKKDAFFKIELMEKVGESIII